MGDALQVAGTHKTLAQRVVSNSFWSILSQGLGRGLTFLANLYLARVLGVANFGLFTLAQFVALSIWTGVDLGTSMYGIREIARDPKRAGEITSDLLGMRLLLALAFLTLVGLSVWIVPMSVPNRLATLSCCLYVATYSVYPDWVCRGLEQFQYIAFGSLMMGMTFLVGVVVLVQNQGDLLAACLVWSLSALCGSFPLLYVVHRKLGVHIRPRWRPAAWLRHSRESVFYAVGGLLLAANQYLPAFLLGAFFASYEVGLFSAPFKIAVTLGAAGYLIPMAFFPILAESHRKDSRRFMKAHRAMRVLMLSLGLPVAIVGTAFARPIVELLFGASYAGSVPVFKVLAWLVPLWFFRYTYGMTLAATGLQKRQNVAALAATTGMALLGLLLISKFGLLGGAWAVLGGEIIMIALMHWLSQPAFEFTESS